MSFDGRAGQRQSWEGGGRRLGEVVGFDHDQAIVMLLGQTGGIRVGDGVTGLQTAQTVDVSNTMLGRVINGIGEPIDHGGPIRDAIPRAISPEPVGAMRRARITEPMYTGIRAIDLMATFGCGQRIGIFAGPGVGKSSLLGAIARGATADVNVIALIGERGREVRDFIEDSLGDEGLARSVVVVATGDESPLLRIRAALVACTVAEHFRDQGATVCLMMDSVTRFAHAHRQVGLSVGEPPATKGYTPSVFAALALLLERAGALGNGTITGLYTILVEGDDMTEPIADAARGILDGHLILSRRLAHRGHYPAIDVLDSVSRVADDVSDAELISARRTLARLLALYTDVEDLVQIGAYARRVESRGGCRHRHARAHRGAAQAGARRARAIRGCAHQGAPPGPGEPGALGAGEGVVSGTIPVQARIGARASADAEKEHQRRVAEIERERRSLEDHIRSCQQRLLVERQSLRDDLGQAGPEAGRGATEASGKRVQRDHRAGGAGRARAGGRARATEGGPSRAAGGDDRPKRPSNGSGSGAGGMAVA